MNVNIRQVPPGVVIQIVGSVDGLTAEDLQSALAGQVQQGETRLVADLAGVDYTSSAGLRVLLATMKDVRKRGGDLRLAAVRPGVLRVLDISGLTSILKIFPDTDAAVASFGG
jgi:anti-sigma B factor antagonist